MASRTTDPGAVRRFGAVAFFASTGLLALAAWAHRPGAVALFGVTALAGAGLAAMPRRLAPLHRGWLWAARGASRVLTLGMLTAVYWVVITPTALLKRLLGGRPLPLRPDRGALSYWIERSEPAQPRERFSKRY